MLDLALMLSALTFGEIYGDVRVGEKYVTDAKIQLTCGGETTSATTDKAGSFRLRVKASGKCTVSVAYENQSPSVEVVLFEQPARYRLVLEQKDGKYALKRV